MSQASLGKDNRVGREKFSIASQLLLQRALEHAIYVCSLAYDWLKSHVFLMHFCSALLVPEAIFLEVAAISLSLLSPSFLLEELTA